MKSTISVLKADIGSLAGHHMVHPDTIAVATKVLSEGKKQGIINDFYPTSLGMIWSL